MKIGGLHDLLQKNFQAAKTKFQLCVRRRARIAGDLALSIHSRPVRAVTMGVLSAACLKPAHMQSSAASVFILMVASLPVVLKANPLTRTGLW